MHAAPPPPPAHHAAARPPHRHWLALTSRAGRPVVIIRTSTGVRL